MAAYVFLCGNRLVLPTYKILPIILGIPYAHIEVERGESTINDTKGNKNNYKGHPNFPFQIR